MALGYNIDHPIQSEPECEFVIEQDYENSPGQHQLECYIQLQKFYSGPQIDFIRPLSITYQRQAGGQCFVGVGWLNGGMLNFGGGTQSVPLNEWQLSDGITQIDPATSHGTYVFKCSSTLFSIQSDHGLALSAVGAMEVDMASGQVFSFNSDQITFQTAAHGAKCQLDTTIDSARFFPISSHTGSIGVDSRRWKACFADSLAMQQVTKTAAYVIDSGATPDGVIWVDTSGTPAFALTLPAATVGRVLIVQDIGGNLAAANVTLTRPGGNKINGAAADLALATNRATWEVVSNGTDWITGKSVTGG
jgi:hypothetical protein